MVHLSLFTYRSKLLIPHEKPDFYLQEKATIKMSKLDAAELFSVKGLVAVVTGAGSGLGAYMAHALDINGAAKVFILGRRESKLKEVAAKAVRDYLRQMPIVSFTLLGKCHVATSRADTKLTDMSEKWISHPGPMRCELQGIIAGCRVDN